MKQQLVIQFALASALTAVIAIWPQELRSQDAGVVNENGLMGSVEIPSDDLSALPQWTRVLGKIPEEKILIKKCEVDIKNCSSTKLIAWRAKIQEARTLPPLKQLRVVNRFINSWPISDDQKSYKKQDYWASPMEFSERSGDSKDFAIIKFFMLRELGFANKNLRIVIAIDTLRNKPQAFVTANIGKNVYVLDNLSNTIQTDNFLRHFVPTYSVNETTRWAHIPARFGGTEK